MDRARRVAGPALWRLPQCFHVELLVRLVWHRAPALRRHRFVMVSDFRRGSVRHTVPRQGAVHGGVAMHESWETVVTGPPDAARSVLLLPGGACAARSFNLVTAEPALSGVRLVATTLPGN